MIGDVEAGLLNLLAEVRDSIQTNERLLSESLYRVASGRRRLNRAFGMSGSSDTIDARATDQPSVPPKPDNPLLREKARQAIERKRMPNRQPVRLGGVAGGVGRMCSVCERPVTTEETDLELLFSRNGVPGPAVYHVHVRCYSAWVRTIRGAADGVSEKER